MPILDQTNGADFAQAQKTAAAHYIFCDRDILLANGALPDKDFFDAFVAQQEAAKNLDRLICEAPQNYAAAKIARRPDSLGMPENSSQDQKAAPSGQPGSFSQEHNFIPLREFVAENPTLAPAAMRAKGILFWRDTYRHCPKCGAAFINDKDETALLCPECSFKLYPRIEPCVIVLIRRGDEILLAMDKKRGTKFYSCIAGFMELGESAIQAVTREVKEEVGIEIKNIKAVGSQSWPFPDQLMLAFTAEWKSGDLVLQESEIADARWFKADQLPPPEQLPGRGSVAWNLIHDKF